MTERDPIIQTRLALPGDAVAIASMLYRSFAEFQHLYTPEGFAATVLTAEQVQMRMQEGQVWVAFRTGAIVGTVSAVPKGDGLHVRSMAVVPEARGHHIGEMLLEQIEKYAHEGGYTRLFLSTTPFLSGAIRLYEKCGFQRKSTGSQDLFGTPLFSMEKVLE